MDDVSTQLRKGSLELAVLALLSAAPRYGADVVEDLSGRPGLEATSGTIYPLLTRLKNAKLVETTRRPVAQNRQEVRPFQPCEYGDAHEAGQPSAPPQPG